MESIYCCIFFCRGLCTVHWCPLLSCLAHQLPRPLEFSEPVTTLVVHLKSCLVSSLLVSTPTHTLWFFSWPAGACFALFIYALLAEYRLLTTSLVTLHILTHPFPAGMALTLCCEVFDLCPVLCPWYIYIQVHNECEPLDRDHDELRRVTWWRKAQWPWLTMPCCVAEIRKEENLCVLPKAF